MAAHTGLSSIVRVDHSAATSLTKDWAFFLARTRMRSEITIICDDAVVQSLFGQLNPRSAHRSHVISRLASSDHAPIESQRAKDLHDEFEAAKDLLLAPDPTFARLLLRANAFVERESVVWWRKVTLGKGRDIARAFEWDTGEHARYMFAYMVLLSPWTRVKLSVPVVGSRRQFAIYAKENIAVNTKLFELAGTLSTDRSDAVDHTQLSVMNAGDGSKRILSGPIRLVNHHCKANCEYEQLDDSTPDAITLCTVARINAGDEITVIYGDGYWSDDEEGCPCGNCRPKELKPEAGPSRIVDDELKSAAKKRKNQWRRDKCKEAKRSKKEEASSTAANGSVDKDIYQLGAANGSTELLVTVQNYVRENKNPVRKGKKTNGGCLTSRQDRENFIDKIREVSSWRSGQGWIQGVDMAHWRCLPACLADQFPSARMPRNLGKRDPVGLQYYPESYTCLIRTPTAHKINEKDNFVTKIRQWTGVPLPKAIQGENINLPLGFDYDARQEVERTCVRRIRNQRGADAAVRARRERRQHAARARAREPAGVAQRVACRTAFAGACGAHTVWRSPHVRRVYRVARGEALSGAVSWSARTAPPGVIDDWTCPGPSIRGTPRDYRVAIRTKAKHSQLDRQVESWLSLALVDVGVAVENDYKEAMPKARSTVRIPAAKRKAKTTGRKQSVETQRSSSGKKSDLETRRRGARPASSSDSLNSGGLYAFSDVTRAEVYLVHWEPTDAKQWEPDWRTGDIFTDDTTLKVFWKNADTDGKDYLDLEQWDVGETVESTTMESEDVRDTEEGSETYQPPDEANPNATRVYARWRDGAYYPGTVAHEVSPGLWTVWFDDQTSCDVTRDNMRRDAPRTGDRVEVSVDLVTIQRIEEDGTIIVQQEGSKKMFPVPADEITRGWNDRLVEGDIVCMDAPA
ncbi:hypothetical protein B0H11DRAFT_1938780 [Mycena galericulata]|nr:hypothetical protein B0H11DRAFT_1938780 [Mycena galericulata]